MYNTLIEAESLYQILDNTNLVILDCRFNLADTTAGQSQYRGAHIPGAHYAHLDDDLSSPIIAGVSGRHPLPQREDFIRTLRAWGVNTDSQVVVYDHAPGAIAARAWWLCQWVGVDKCAVLDGGLKAWETLQYPVTADTTIPMAGTVSLGSALVNFLTVDDLVVNNQTNSGLPDSRRLLVDARDPERYDGTHEPLDPVGGHIPGAVNFPFTGNLGPDNKFLDRISLRARFDPLMSMARDGSGYKSRAITHYCGSGVTAAHNILAMVHAGFPLTDLYAGSWSEWVQDESRPVERTTHVE